MINKERVANHIRSLGEAVEFTAEDIEKGLGYKIPIRSIRALLKSMSDTGFIEQSMGPLRNGMKVYFIPEVDGPAEDNDLEDLEGDDVMDYVETDVNSIVIPDVGVKTQFETDQRDNPQLHALYVGYAMEDLETVNAAMEELNSRSRWPASQIANDLFMRRRQFIMTDAAYFEAAALLMAGFSSEEFQKEHGNYDLANLDDDI